MKRYAVREQFLTLQGEGGRTGQKSYFVRFAGCNLWNGRPEDRERGSAECSRWCDTDFAKGQPQTADDIIAQADAAWPQAGDPRWFVFTGGEPLLQVDEALLHAAHQAGWKVAIETNGTVLADMPGIDWLTVSPKLGSSLVQLTGHELKVVLPGVGPEREGGWTDEALEALRLGGSWERSYVQPQDAILASAVEHTYLKRSLLGAEREFKQNLKRCIDFVQAHPVWSLSFQVHKVTGLR